MSTVGASSTSTLSYLQSLLQQGGAKDAKKSSATDPLSMLMQAISGDDEAPAQTSATASAPAKAAQCQSFSAETMATLLSAQSEPDSPSAKLFAKLDADGDGKISKTEFGAAAEKAGADSAVADAVFAKIDGDSDGAVSAAELGKADRGGHRHHHHVESATASTVSAQDVSSSDSASQSTLNKRAANLLEQLIKLQSQVLNVATSTMSAVA